MIRKQWIVALSAALTLVSAQLPAMAQYGPPASGSSAAIFFTPATVGLVAGLNGQGSTGNGGLATAAKLYYPVGIAYDSSGNLFIADESNYVVRRIDHVTGDISIFAGTNATFGDSLGGGVATNAQIGLVAGLVIDTSNNVYVSDRSNNVVWKITSGGTISLYAGGGSSGLGDGGLATAATLNNPWALGIDASNNIYISDSYNDLVRVVNHSTNIITTFAGDIADAGTFGCNASLYTTSTPPFTPTQAHLCFPEGVAFDSAGNAYIVDASNKVVRIVNKSTGFISTFAGGGTQAASVNGIPATTASMTPSGVYVDPGNRVYIADNGGNLVRVVDSTGNINTVYGTGFGSMTSAAIGLPDTEALGTTVGVSDGIYGMAMDTFGDLIAASSSGSAITSAGTTGQYRFPQVPIFTTETSTQANAANSFYPASVTISNPSGVALNLAATPTVTGPFAIVTGSGAGTCTFPGTVAAGQSCTLVLSFTPTLGGSPGTVQTGTVVIASNANSTPSTISLYGTGTGTATVTATLTTSPLVFTSAAGVTSASQNATLSNTGQLPIAIGSTQFNGFSPTNFAVSATTCPTGSATLAIGSSCTYSITFTPSTATTYSAGFQACITTSSYGCLTISLQGTGTAGATATLLPTPLAFGSVTAGQTSAALSATLHNTSSTAMTISSYAIGGTNPSDFAVGTGTNACGSTLAASASCIVYVTFTPASVGSYSGQLSVTDSATGSPQTVALSGTGVQGAIPPSPLVFNAAPVGVSLASAQTLTATFQVNGFSSGFTPTAKLHYGLSYSIGAVTCSGPTGALSCSVPVTFQPQYPGGRREALFLMVGSTRLASVLIYGIGQSPFALVQPGVITQPINNSSGYNYTSIVDENGTAYVIQSGGNAVVSVTKAGVVTTLPLTGINVADELGIDGAGVLYIAGGSPLNQVTTYDTVLGVQGSVPYGSGVSNITGIAVGNTGNIYETDGTKVYTVPISGTGTAAAVTISPTVNQGYILASDSSDDIFVSGYTINELPSGGTQVEVNTVGASEGLGVDAAGTLYATRYSPTGGVAELPASGYGTALASLDTGSPLGDSVGPDGTVYVGNYNNLDKVDRSQGLIAFGQVGAVASLNASIYNGGNQPLTFTSFTTSGTGFTVASATTNPCTVGIALAPGAVCQVTVTLTSPHAGFYAGTLTYTDNSLNGTASTQNVTLTGQAYGDYLIASPTSLNFNTQAIGTTSAPQTITLTNYGDGYPANIAPITGGGPFNFSLGTCTTPLAPATSATSPGGSCQLSVTFSPTTTTAYSNTQIGIVSLSPPFPNVVLYVGVSGTGTSASAPSATLSPTSLAFPSTTVGVAATSLPVTLSNSGTAALAITSIAVSSGSGFGQTNNCGGSVAIGGSCIITVSFTPGATGALGATLTVTDSATGSPQTLNITGTGAAALAPLATLSPTTLTFPSTTVGVAATSLPVTLSNPGTAALTITSVLTTNASAGFSQTNNCGGSVAAGSSCTFTVSFTPTASGAVSGSISISDNAASATQTITLNGTGAAVLSPQVTFSPTSLSFPSTTVGVAATALPITLSNPGTAALAITSISVTGANSGSFGETNTCGSSVAAGSSCTITVSFTPGSAGSLAAAISVVDNASGSTQSVTLAGTAVAPGGATFTVSTSTPTASVQPGGVAQFNLVIAPVGGSYTNVVTLTATGLPAGAQASFLPPTVTPGATGAPSVLSIQTVASGLAHLTTPARPGQTSVPVLALLAGLPLLGFAGASRKLRRSAGRWMLLCFAVLSILPLLALSGCGGGYFGPAPQTYTVTVVGTSGALQQSTTISLTVQ